jgi:hypothetical protein
MTTTGKNDALDDTAHGSESPQGDIDLESRRRELAEIVAHNRRSDVDIRDVLPDTAALRKEASPRRADEKLRDASLTPVPGRASAPSPWARGAPDAEEIDTAALPSAMGPDAQGSGEADTAHVKPPAPRASPDARRASVPKLLGAVIAVFAPLVLMYVLLVRPIETRPETRTDATNAPSEAPRATAEPIVARAAPVPSASTATSATVLPLVAPTTAPSAAPSLPPTPINRHPAAGSPADAGVPSPPKTAEPASPPSPVTPQAPPPKPEAID